MIFVNRLYFNLFKDLAAESFKGYFELRHKKRICRFTLFRSFASNAKTIVMRMTITKKLIINFFVLSLLPLVVIDTLFYSIAKDALIGRTFEQLTFVRVEKSTRINAFMEQCIHDLKNITSDRGTLHRLRVMESTSPIGSSDSLTSSVYTRFLITYLQTAGCYSSVTYYVPGKNPHVVVLDTSLHQNDQENSLRQMYEQIVDSTPLIQEDVSGFTGNNMVLNLGGGVFQNGKKIGMIVLTLPLEMFSRIMFEDNPMNGLGETGESYLVGPDFLMRSTSRFTENAVMQIPARTKGVEWALADSSGTGIFKDYRGVPVLSSFGKVGIPQLNWIILAEIDAREAMVPIFVLRNSIIYLSIIIAMLLLGIVIFNATWIMLPIKKLQAAAEVISQGKFGNTIQLKQRDEIGDLVEAFNSMSQTLQEQSERLEHEKVMRTTSMIDAQEAERQHLSRELHDGLGQLVLAIRMKLDQLTCENAEKNDRLITETRELIKVTVNEIRNISNNLMPTVLHEFGLMAAIGRLAKETAANSGLQVDFQCNFKENELINSRVQIYVYRMVQEAFNNIIKHAQAKNVQVDLNKVNDTLLLKITDDGKGFKVRKRSYFSGNGIANMKERTNLLGGQFQLQSALNEGTRIVIEIPL